MIVVASAAVVTDLRNWKIPNGLVALGMIQGFVVSAVMRGLTEGALLSMAGCIIPTAVLYVFFLIRALGAGDIKLMAVAGTFIGPDVYRVIIYSFLAGGVLSIVYLLKEIILSITSRKKISESVNVLKMKVHFSIAVLGGILCYVGNI